MSPKTAQHNYRWLPTYFTPDYDFVGYDGERIIGRVTLEGRLGAEGAWQWSNRPRADVSGFGIQQGYAASKELAVEAVEHLDQEIMDPSIQAVKQ
ncbi:hypothetical protein [Pararhizobium sp. PWRC1-1]|uniref:hypothetical protein n=1 Tax=Pararhizobium sp. PWRC1-1 TaxID=2804566 RepID=UPI003CF7AC5A